MRPPPPWPAPVEDGGPSDGKAGGGRRRTAPVEGGDGRRRSKAGTDGKAGGGRRRTAPVEGGDGRRRSKAGTGGKVGGGRRRTAPVEGGDGRQGGGRTASDGAGRTSEGGDGRRRSKAGTDGPAKAFEALKLVMLTAAWIPRGMILRNRNAIAFEIFPGNQTWSMLRLSQRDSKPPRHPD